VPAIDLSRIAENLNAARLRLAGTYVENLPWLECMKRYDREHTFFYLDPPYWQTYGYGVDFGFEQYEQMAEFMRTCKGRVMVNINDHPDIRRVFYGFTMMGLDIKYSIGSTHDQPGVSKELVITNWDANAVTQLF
jgi:DNA adenine methylase